jgi:hypothetical protein
MRYGLPLLFCVSLAAAGLQGLPAQAQMFSQVGATSAPVSVPLNHYSPSHRFFVEFRARNAASYGHMYVMYGEVNDRHEVINSEIAGFFPAGDSGKCVNCSVYYWTMGHVVPVPAEIGTSDGDLEEQYVLARYRVWVDAAQYRRLVAYIRQRKTHLGPWHAFLNNCVTFGRDVAVFLNMKVPVLMAVSPSVVMYPKDVVEWLRDANGGEKNQGPLKDAPGALPAEVVAKMHAAKPTQAAEATDAGAGQSANAEEKPAAPAPKNRLANKHEENKVDSSAIH